MTVSVSFFGHQRNHIGSDCITVELTPDSRAVDILRYVQRQYPGLNLSENGVLISINDRVCPHDHPLKTDDIVSFLPHIGGG
jgi:molybdopterin converting factor small subunit